jgi:flagellar biosynthetic protein FlhB
MSERTEAPTPRHLAEMRRRGETALSVELTQSITLLVGVWLLASRLPALMEGLLQMLHRSFTGLDQGDLANASLQALARAMEGWLPFLATLAAVGIVASLAQTRGLVAFRRLQPSLERINPWAGLRRVFSARGLFETAKGLVKMAILGIILYQSLRALPGRLALASQAGLGPGLAVLGDALSRIAKQGAALLVLAASADYVYQWRQYRQRIKMTREEVMEELKNAEGQPFIKAKIRQLQRRWSRQRMMAQLVRADVVVTNPTHVAVALRYDRATMLAPIVVAKGKGLIAEQIMRKARELGIPLVQNIPLAHALIRVELGEQIPVNLYRAVAEVLAFVYRLRKEGRA